MRKGQHRNTDKPWGSYTQQEAEKYYVKLGIQCCDLKTYQRWFQLAERGNFSCRTLKSFCKDCLPNFCAAMTKDNRCVKVGIDTPESR